MSHHDVFPDARHKSVCLALGAALALAAPALAQDNYAEIYRNPVEFDKVSNAMQNLLIAKFGPRLALDEKGNFIVPTAAGFTRELPTSSVSKSIASGNVLVNNAAADATAQDTQSETALVLGSGSKLVAAFNDSGSFIGANHFTGWAHSSNSGATWTDPGILPGANDAGDPVLARDDTTGRIYLACLFFTGSGINCFRSDNDGVSWLAATNAAPSSGSMDKAWMTVDNFAGAGNGNVYLVVRDFGSGNGVFFFRSLDQGATFAPFGGTLIASGSPSNVQGAYVVVTPNHDVHAFWYDSNPVPAQLRTRTSSDQGLTWSAPVTVTALTSNATNGNLTLVAGFRSNSFPQITVNPVSGAIYLVYNDPVAVSGGDRGNVLLRQSVDNGLTWSAPVVVNDDGTTRAQYFPAIACRPDGTGLAVCWYDNRNDPADINLERWGVTASISGATLTFGPNFRLSPQFPPVFGVDPVVNTVYMGDYDQMAADNTNYYTTWGDDRDNSIAVPTRKNANVRFTSFDQSGPGAILSFNSFTVAGGNLNGQIDFNECNDMTVAVKNDGANPATSVSATLSSSTPGVTILNATQSYPDLAAGATEVNAAPFQVSTSPAFACGTAISFTLTLTHATGTDVVTFAAASSSDYLITVGSGTLVAGTTDIGNHGDDVVTTISLPFPVAYYSTSYNQITLSSNGTAQFSGANNAYSNVCLPTAAFSDTILPHWDDLRTDGAGEGIFRSVTGVTPSREFHLEWRTHYFSGVGTAKFELRLHENTSSFELIYDTVGQGGTGATIGCQKGTGTSFSQQSCNGSITAGTKLSFVLPTCPNGGGQCGGPFTPVVTSVAPALGPNSGVTGVVITGSSFTGASAVSFGPNAASFTVDNDTQITANLGATATTGLVNVSVTNVSGTGTLTNGFDYFAPPVDIGQPCGAQSLTWSGAPVLGQNYTVTTQNLGGASQVLLIDWSYFGGAHSVRRYPPGPCPVRLDPDFINNLGTTPGFTFPIANDLSLVGTHLRTQAMILAPAATTQVLDAKIGQ